jgi:hypothetical protein
MSENSRQNSIVDFTVGGIPFDLPKMPNTNPSCEPFIDVFLCVKTKDKLGTFSCDKFCSFKKADEYFNETYKKADVLESAMVPVSKLWPEFMKPYVLQHKTAKVLIKLISNQINIKPN